MPHLHGSPRRAGRFIAPLPWTERSGRAAVPLLGSTFAPSVRVEAQRAAGSPTRQSEISSVHIYIYIFNFIFVLNTHLSRSVYICIEGTLLMQRQLRGCSSAIPAARCCPCSSPGPRFEFRRWNLATNSRLPLTRFGEQSRSVYFIRGTSVTFPLLYLRTSAHMVLWCCAELGFGLHGPCGPLPTRDVLWFCVSVTLRAEGSTSPFPSPPQSSPQL